MEEDEPASILNFNVRYGRNYKVVLAIVLPCLLIVPFIYILHKFPDLTEWKVWVIIYAFLGLLISSCLWLVFRIYPSAILSIDRENIKLNFNPKNLLCPRDFSFQFIDIISLTAFELNGDKYYVFKLRNPSRKFQVSPATYDINNTHAFLDAMDQISELINAKA